MMIGTPLLEVEDLYVYFDIYEGIAKVLNGINLKVYEGEKVGLVGETGCGKSVTMKAIMRILSIPPACIPKGKILFKDQDILKMGRREFQRIRGKGISMIFQDPMSSLNPVFKVGEQLIDVIRFSQIAGNKGVFRYLLKVWDKHSQREFRTKALSILEEVKLPDPERIFTSYLVQLSGGMMQRVLIAMALVNGPALLIADEPGTALDVTIQDEVLRLLHGLVKRRETSVLLITHNMGVVREITDRVYVMYAGNVVEEAQTKELFSNPKHPYTKGLLASVPKLTGGGISEGIKGRIPSYTNPPTGCRFRPRCEHAMKKCEMRPPMVGVSDHHRVHCFLYNEK